MIALLVVAGLLTIVIYSVADLVAQTIIDLIHISRKIRDKIV